MTADQAPAGVPYHRAVEGPDGRYWWAQCPECGAVVPNRDGFGPARHWAATHEHDTHGCGPGERPDDCPKCLAEAEREASR